MRLHDSSDIQRVMTLYAPMVYRLAYARTRSHSDAEDISQEVFLALARKNPDFDAEKNRCAWLVRVTVNYATSLWRSAWRRRVTLGDESARHQAAPEKDQALADALDALPGDDRVLLQLFYFEGFRTDEIAAMLGRSPSTVRTRLARARKRLKAELIGEVES